MKTLLLDKTGNVYKILRECFRYNEITYLCELGKWCFIKACYSTLFIVISLIPIIVIIFLN